MNCYPSEMGLTFPAEWENHRACWLAWPWDASLWKEDLLPVQKEFIALCRAIQSGPSDSQIAKESIYCVSPSPLHRRQAERSLGEENFRYFEAHYGDIWLRDTAPLFVTDRKGDYCAVHFKFNGWGGKYNLRGDDTVGQEISRFSGMRVFHAGWVLEGGSIDTDGQGLCLTTRQCLLNPNRNPGMNEGDVDQALRLWLGQEKILWLDEGLLNDHTDGHVDNIARFIRPGAVVCMRAESNDDPNRKVLADIEARLRSFTDRNGRALEVITMPSPGPVLDGEGKIRPASYVNFYISNTSVVVPLYGTPFDDKAVESIANVFPGRKVIGLRADHLLSGGGSFHCITQQFPGDAAMIPSKVEPVATTPQAATVGDAEENE
jgi:agmatine deiminase